MFNKFWEQNKHQLQFVGVLIAIGALFLSIPVPEIEKAAEALQKIQFLWLLIVTVSTTLLFLKLFTLSRLYELDSSKDKSGFNYDETVSIVIGVTFFYFILNMWRYANSLYREVFFDYVGTVKYAASVFLFATTYHYWRKMVLKFENSNPKLRVSIAIIGHVVNAFVLGVWFHISNNNWQFIWTEWIYWSIGTFVVMMTLWSLIDWKRNKDSTLGPSS